MNRILLSTCLTILTLNSCSQDYTVRKHVESNPHFPEEEYTFPILEGSNKTVTDRINSYLIKDYLDIELGEEETSIFENVWQKPDDVIARISYLTYQVDFLNDNLYTVTLSGEFCSAYCEGFDMSYTFDLISGNLLTLDTLFNKNGQEKLLRQLIDHKSELINQKVHELHQINKSDTLDSDEQELYQDMLVLYENCNSEYSNLEHFRFIPSQDSIKIIYGRCSAHYNRSIDELWYFEKAISIDEWTEQLSETGKERLTN